MYLNPKLDLEKLYKVVSGVIDLLYVCPVLIYQCAGKRKRDGKRTRTL